MINDKVYDNIYFSDLDKIYERQTHFKKNRMNNVLELIGQVNGLKILDLGTANGLFAIECARNGAFSVGLDFSKIALKNAKNFANISNMEIDAICSDCSILPFKSNSFDLILLVDLVEHLNMALYEKTIKECYRVLKYGGRIALYTPNKEHLIERLRKRNIFLSTFTEHTNLMNLQEVLIILKKSNFLIEKAYFRPSHIPFFNALETILIPLFKNGNLFGRRICVLGKK